jgi:hypothetical protein
VRCFVFAAFHHSNIPISLLQWSLFRIDRITELLTGG